MWFSLFSFGFSLNSTNKSNEELTYLILDDKDFSELHPSELSFGIIHELLTNCKVSRFNRIERCKREEYLFLKTRDFRLFSFFPPLFLLSLAIFTALCIVQVNKLTIIPPNKEETIPVKMYCLKSFNLPEVELLPQYFDIQQTEIPKSWGSIVNDPIEDSLHKLPIFVGDVGHIPIGGNIKIFDAVDLKSSDIVFKPIKSLFSSENWY